MKDRKNSGTHVAVSSRLPDIIVGNTTFIIFKELQLWLASRPI